ncbi:hypothetical protein COHA_007041 [Chlorella ohadii]|uniref:RING-type E3 ubiquitin transferase n=1 Tax=Chlorella ohadii TaxID=2649997 RepID=A0AAD5DMV5_9CHLO|nr:hypothetical protein COHA_007041 [Chlorella ohadii]
MTLALETSAHDFAALQTQLGKKQSFVSATQALAAALSSPTALEDAAARAAIARCFAVLRARYTSRAFWLEGRQLFRAAQTAAAAQGDAAFQQQLQEYIREANAFLEEEDEDADAGVPSAAVQAAAAAPGGRSGSGFLFEGQLSGAEPPPRQPDLMSLLGSALGQQLAAAQAAAQAQQQQQQQQPGGGGGDIEGADQQQQAAAAAGPPPEVLEAIERELDAIAVQIMEETGQQAPPRAPPASKKAVASLPKESLTEERLRELGGPDVRCPVCMEDLAVGDEVQVMPCNAADGKHVFHPPCLAPWLAENNSCPTCRHELPTDDQQYERRKEREREEAEERRGAENAVSHNEFLYI